MEAKNEPKNEIDEIMGELEKLQAEMASSSGAKPAATDLGTSDLRLAPEPVPVPVPVSTTETSHEVSFDQIQEEEVGKIINKTAGNGALTLNVQGGLALRLVYEFDGKQVVLTCEDQFLRVELADGTEFKVPLTTGSVSHRLKAVG